MNDRPEASTGPPEDVQPPEVELPVPVQQTAIIHPGDKLIVRFEPHIAAAQLHDAAERLRAQLPGIEILVINAEEIQVVRQELTSVQLHDDEPRQRG